MENRTEKKTGKRNGKLVDVGLACEGLGFRL